MLDELNESIDLIKGIESVYNNGLTFDPSTMLIYNTGKSNLFGGCLQVFFDKDTMQPVSAKVIR